MNRIISTMLDERREKDSNTDGCGVKGGELEEVTEQNEVRAKQEDKPKEEIEEGKEEEREGAGRTEKKGALRQEEKREDMCFKHNEPLRMFCDRDKEWICVSCWESEHNDHMIKTLRQAEEEMKKEVTASLVLLQHGIEDVDELRRRQEIITSSNRQRNLLVRTHISSQFKKVREQLRVQEERAVRQIKELNEDADRRLTEMEEVLRGGREREALLKAGMEMEDFGGFFHWWTETGRAECETQSPLKEKCPELSNLLLSFQSSKQEPGFGSGLAQPEKRAPGFGFGISHPEKQALGFSFGTAQPEKQALGFSFGTAQPEKQALGFSFGTAQPEKQALGFSFGTAQPEKQALGFSFGTAQPEKQALGFSFGTAQPEKFSFGQNALGQGFINCSDTLTRPKQPVSLLEFIDLKAIEVSIFNTIAETQRPQGSVFGASSELQQPGRFCTTSYPVFGLHSLKGLTPKP
ncbi:uncharacterized protein LOC105006425 isoform X1 [Esox lucius]|uniref:uncharacterized protein LOC105006425 isoform X1 n=2 Tax=Esox lucius TaxID=8010 RepID=UPI00147759F2|nr:uncharacterized protein LOC105006425 isoform X1 [Esox lucius]